MSELFSPGDADLLRKHLQALIEVELFTIPFYLTAVYSFTNRALAYVDDQRNTPLYDIQQNALSVAVQEMYHLQLACNLANVFNVTPELPKMNLVAGEEITIPHLERNGAPITTSLGNLPAVIAAMIEVEAPDPNPDFPPPNPEVVYGSISDLYHATLQLLAQYLQATSLLAMSADPDFNPGHNQVAYGTFPQTYTYNAITTRPLVAKAANAITDQGEGNLVGPEALLRSNAVAAMLPRFFSFGDDGDVLPEYQPKEGTRFYKYGKTTHYKRFEDIQSRLQSQDWAGVIGGQVFYTDGEPSADLPAWAPPYAEIASSLGTIWSYLTDAMQTGFATGNLSTQPSTPDGPGFNDAMLAFKYTIPLAWQSGYTPSFPYAPGVTPAEAQKAMDTVDPLCLFHWDAVTARLRATSGFQMNACQGLNQCAGTGWGGIATEKGNGACATADLHTCGANNDCKFQGGCGFLVTGGGSGCGASSGVGDASSLLPPSEQWIPGQNSCTHVGGCQTPISTGQVFDSSAGPTIEKQEGSGWDSETKKQLEALIGTSVWDRARAIFARKEGLATLPAPIAGDAGGMHYDGTARREAVQPTSK